jgi:hypothetical protein
MHLTPSVASAVGRVLVERGVQHFWHPRDAPAFTDQSVVIGVRCRPDRLQASAPSDIDNGGNRLMPRRCQQFCMSPVRRVAIDLEAALNMLTQPARGERLEGFTQLDRSVSNLAYARVTKRPQCGLPPLMHWPHARRRQPQ